MDSTQVGQFQNDGGCSFRLESRSIFQKGEKFKMNHLTCRRLHVFPLLIFSMLVWTGMLHAQVTVAPSMLFIDSKSGIGNLYITNNSASPQEVTVSFAFGFPDADSTGNPTMNYTDTVAANTYSLNSMIRAYPRSFLLTANQQQTVRLQVRSKNSDKNAFYFTRVKISSNPESPNIERKVTDSVAAQITFKFDQILPVFYRKGDVSTGLNFHGVSTSINDKKLNVVADVERTGTAPFIGSMKAELYSPSNESVALIEATSAIYFRLKDKMEIDISKFVKGQYRLVLTYETRRADVAAEDLLQALPATKEVTVNIP